jgi:hypothetical protein
MRAYSEDLRQTIVQTVERRISKSQTAPLVGISFSSVKRYAAAAHRGEALVHREGINGSRAKTSASLPLGDS